MADKQHMILNRNWEKGRSIVGKDGFAMNMEGKNDKNKCFCHWISLQIE